MADESLPLTIYLLKKDQVAAFDQRFPADAPGTLPLANGLDGRFVPIPSTPRVPRWVTAIAPFLATTNGPSLTAQSPSGLLVLIRAGRTFVISFGHAWQSLQDDWLERDFGRRVALNLMAKDGLLEIRAEQVFAKWHVASERAPRATTVDEFGVEFDRDLVGAVEGVPEDDRLGGRIRGATNFRLSLALAALGPFLDKAEGRFQSNAYKKNWPDIDNLMPVKSRAIVEKLEALLDRDLGSSVARKRIVMFTPMFRRDEPLVAHSYVYGRLAASSARTPYLGIDGWVDELGRRDLSPSLAEARHAGVHLLDENGDLVKGCSAFQCFGYEIELGGRQYVLSSGTWYEAADDFWERVNRQVTEIAAPSVTLPRWNQVHHEDEYNRQCCTDPNLLHFDCKKIWYGGGKSQFEFCDMFHPKGKVLVFAKIASRSSGMSHLVEQARRTRELLFSTDGTYRKELQGVFKKHHPAADRTWLNGRPQIQDWEFCLISLGRSAKELPFFAKCSLMNLHADLRERGHKVTFGPV